MDKFVETVEKGRGGGGLGRHVLGVFAKQPIAGQVKTRLSPPLSSAQAAELYQVSLQESLARLQHPGWDLVLFYAGEKQYFSRAFPDVTLRAQTGDGLGERLQAAFRQLQEEGYGCAALVGSDSPDLPLEIIRSGFEALQEVDLVTAPAADGGYVLIGIRRPLPEVFEGIPWSTAEVLQATRERVARLKLAYRELAGWEDLDDVASLRRLIQRSPASATAGYARQLLGLATAG